MKKINEFDTHLQHILREMCRVVGADAEKINFKQHDWYMLCEWTEEQEGAFGEWLAMYLYEDKDARREMLQFYRSRESKRRCREAAANFIWNYGWHTTLEEGEVKAGWVSKNMFNSRKK